MTDRRSSVARGAHEAELDDIIGILQIADIADHLKSVLFVAANLEAMPRHGPGEINVAAVVDRQSRVETILKVMSDAIQQLSFTQFHPVDSTGDRSALADVQSNMKDIQAKLDSFVFSVATRLDHVQSVFQSSLNTSTHRDDKMNQDEIDRRSNVIIFGVPAD
jgi:hypothetical protein